MMSHPGAPRTHVCDGSRWRSRAMGGRAMHVLISWLTVFLSVCLQAGVGPGSRAVQAVEQSGFTEADVRLLRGFMAGQRACRDVPSMSVSVVSGGRVVMEEGLGLADLEQQTPATRDTVYCVASLTKAFTSTLLAKLIVKKNLSWDTPLTSVLPAMYGFKDDYRTKHVTLRDLLLHRTGIPRNDFLWISGLSDRDQLYRSIKCMPQEKDFRATALYNNILYSVAGDAAESLGGAPWHKLVERELLEPLNMTSTTFLQYMNHRTRRKARQYSYTHENILISDPLRDGAVTIGPAIAVCSTASDMAKWTAFQLSKGRDAGGREVVPRNMMGDIHTGQVSAHEIRRPRYVDEDGGVRTSYDMYGLGWFKGYHRGHEASMHYGSYPGFYSMISMLPGKNFGIFSSINGGRNERSYTLNSLIHSYAMDLALDRTTPWPDVSSACNFTDDYPFSNYTLMPSVVDCKDAIINDFMLPARHLTKYSGTYSHPVFGNLTFSIKSGRLRLKFNKIIFETVPQTEDTFCIQTVNSSWSIAPQQATFSHHAHDGTLIYVSVPFITGAGEGNSFQRLPPGVSYEQWREGKCGPLKVTMNSCLNQVNYATRDVASTVTIFYAVVVLFSSTVDFLYVLFPYSKN